MCNHVVTISEMKKIEKEAAESGLSYYQMMENAGFSAYSYIKSNAKKNSNIIVFCGKGNNGGDGFVAARKFIEDGFYVQIVLVDGQPKTLDAQKNKELCEALHIPILDIAAQKKQAKNYLKSAHIIVDAIYGTGFHGELNQSAQLAAQWINETNIPVYALDIPSGLNGDSGIAASDAVKADYTIAFHRYKPVHFAKAASAYCGKLACVDIGITS